MNENKMINITFENGETLSVMSGTTLLELSKFYEKNHRHKIVAAKVDKDIKELTKSLNSHAFVEFIDLEDEDGMRIYLRSLSFVLIKAVNDIFPERKVVINHSISRGLYYEIIGDKELDEADVEKIKERMTRLTGENLPFERKTILMEDARALLKEMGRDDRIGSMRSRLKTYITVYSCGDYEDYFYGYMTPSTGYVDKFDLKFYNGGVVLLFPKKDDPDRVPDFIEQKKLFNIFRENRNWGSILNVESVAGLNSSIKGGKIRDLIMVSEALHEKKTAEIADMICQREDKKRVVLIAGPSSSGKTTFSQRLGIQLRVNGIRPVTIHLDDYFVNKENTPLDDKGERDYEALEAVDVELFNTQLTQLLEGKEVLVPTFNFLLGKREYTNRRLKLKEDNIIIIEGIHGLNEKLTPSLPKGDKFKIYISAITSMNIDDHNRVPTTDTRLLRRIVRDNRSRGTSAGETIKRWPSVRRGEEMNIFPFQEEADIMFNSSLKYEHGVMRIYAEPLLAGIGEDTDEYAEAKRLLEFLNYFLPISQLEDIPGNSILKEFIGGSCFI